MGIKLSREKERSLLTSGLYRLNHLALRALGEERHFALLLDLEWIANRFAHEASHRHYSPDHHPLRTRTAEFLLDAIEPEHRVLDVGCGDGFVADIVKRRAREVVAIDHDAGSVERARKRFGRPGLTFVVGDAFAHVAAEKEGFDVIVLSHVLEHLDDPGSFLARCRPLARYIYVEVPDFEATPLNTYRVDLHRPLVHTDTDHVSEFDRDELRAIIAGAGLEIQKSDFREGMLRFWCSTGA
jgi:SAM-dependent methyltransferase